MSGTPLQVGRSAVQIADITPHELGTFDRSARVYLRLKDDDAPSGVRQSVAATKPLWPAPMTTASALSFGMPLLGVAGKTSFGNRGESPRAFPIAWQSGSQSDPSRQPTHRRSHWHLGHLDSATTTVGITQPQCDPSLTKGPALRQQNQAFERLADLDHREVVE